MVTSHFVRRIIKWKNIQEGILHIVKSYNTILGKMRIDRLPECPQKELGCPEKIWQCPVKVHDWINGYLTSEDILTRGKSLPEAAEIIFTNRSLIKAAFKERGCTLFDRILQHRAETSSSRTEQGGRKALERILAGSKTASHRNIYR